MKKTVLITGTSSGFGKETVRYFHRKGWNVIATMRSPEKETELSLLEDVLVTRLDVTDKASIQSAVKAGLDRFGSLDVLVNNAGFGTIGPLESAPDESIRKQFDVNFFGVIDVTKAVLPIMRNQKGGLIINVTSLGAIVTYPFLSLYHATKFAVEGLTESMRYELNPLGITLKLVEPGGYQTDFVSRSLVVSNLGQPKEYQTAFSKFTKRLTTGSSNPNLSEVAEVIYAAATDGTDQFRYPAGADAVQLIALKKQMKDSDFKDMIASQMGL